MEAILSSQSVDTDVLSPSLKYGLDASGSWCTGKREATVYALGSSYSPGGVKMISVPFGSTSEWLVPESVLFSANFTNDSSTLACFPATPDANCLFERIDIRCGGQLIESITESARCNELFTRLTMSPQKKINMAQVGFGTQIALAEPDWSSASNHNAGTVPAATTKRIHWKCNLSGILSQHRWIPLYSLSGMGLVCNFYLAPKTESMILSDSGVTYSQDFTLTDVKAHATLQTIDDNLMESFQGQLLNGTALRIPIKKIESIYSYVPNSVTSGKFDVPMSRAYTRLCSLFCSFVQEPPADGSGKAKLCNTFYTHTASAETLSYSLQLGTRRVPDNDVVGFGESWHRLLNAVGIGGSLSHATGITYGDYATSSYAICCDTEKISHLASTGENLSATSTIFLKLAGFGTQASHLPSRAHLIAQTDAVVEIRDSTVELFE